MATIVDSYSESNQSGDEYLGKYSEMGVFAGFSQSFTSNGGVLNSVKFYLKKSGSPTGNAVANIYTHSGTYGSTSIPTGGVLAISDNFDVSSLTTSYQLITFTFSGAEKITLTNGTYYVVTVEYTNESSGNYVLVGDDYSSPSHSGNSAGESGAPLSWSYNTNDLCFYIYKDDATTTTSTSTSTSSSTTSSSSSSSSTSSTSSSSSTSSTSSSSSTSSTSSSSTSSTSSSSSTSTSSTTTLEYIGCLAFGEASPTDGETPISWSTWAGTGAITGDADWGKLELNGGETQYSKVYDHGEAILRQYQLTENKYGTGQGTATVQYRGDTVLFLETDLTPTWTTYTGVFDATYRYIQIRGNK
jgi:hypothetical protein